jgi:hypothetical protein
MRAATENMIAQSMRSEASPYPDKRQRKVEQRRWQHRQSIADRRFKRNGHPRVRIGQARCSIRKLGDESR